MKRFLQTLILAYASAAAASDLDDVTRVFERAVVTECATIVVEYELLGLEPGTPAHVETNARLARRRMPGPDDSYAAMMRVRPAYDRLTEAQRQALSRNSEKAIDECRANALRDYRARVEAGTARPPLVPPQMRPPEAAAPYRPPGGAIERQSPPR